MKITNYPAEFPVLLYNNIFIVLRKLKTRDYCEKYLCKFINLYQNVQTFLISVLFSCDFLILTYLVLDQSEYVSTLSLGRDDRCEEYISLFYYSALLQCISLPNLFWYRSVLHLYTEFVLFQTVLTLNSPIKKQEPTPEDDCSKY